MSYAWVRISVSMNLSVCLVVATCYQTKLVSLHLGGVCQPKDWQTIFVSGIHWRTFSFHRFDCRWPSIWRMSSLNATKWIIKNFALTADLSRMSESSSVATFHFWVIAMNSVDKHYRNECHVMWRSMRWMWSRTFDSNAYINNSTDKPKLPSNQNHNHNYYTFQWHRQLFIVSGPAQKFQRLRYRIALFAQCQYFIFLHTLTHHPST